MSWYTPNNLGGIPTHYGFPVQIFKSRKNRGVSDGFTRLRIGQMYICRNFLYWTDSNFCVRQPSLFDFSGSATVSNQCKSGPILPFFVWESDAFVHPPCTTRRASTRLTSPHLVSQSSQRALISPSISTCFDLTATSTSTHLVTYRFFFQL
jgi:hypothetical protein